MPDQAQLKTVYTSLEAYIHARYITEKGLDNDPTRFESTIPRDNAYIKTVTRQLERLFDRLNIDKTLFQDPASNSYCITEDVRGLFSFMLDRLLVKTNRSKRIPEKFTTDNLIILRDLLLSALESCKTEPDVMKAQLIRYEKSTGCPPKSFYYQHSFPVKDVIAYMTADDDLMLSNVELEVFADQLEYEYRYNWRPRFVDLAYHELEVFLDTINKPELFHDGIAEFFGRMKAPLSPDVWEMRQKRLLNTYLSEVEKEHLFPELWEMISNGKLIMRISEDDIPPNDAEAPEETGPQP